MQTPVLGSCHQDGNSALQGPASCGNVHRSGKVPPLPPVPVPAVPLPPSEKLPPTELVPPLLLDPPELELPPLEVPPLPTDSNAEPPQLTASTATNGAVRTQRAKEALCMHPT